MTNNILNQKIGILTVKNIHCIKTYKYKRGNSYVYYYNCLCECGNSCIKSKNYLLSHSKIQKSCNCIKNKNSKLMCSKSFTKHGLSKTRLFKIFQKMKERCYNINCVSYYLYGDRGITICTEWLNNFMSFYNWAVNNGYKETLTIDRIDNNDMYKPDNCRWATAKEQMSNKRNNHYIVYKNKKFTLTQLAEKFNIKPPTLRRRLKNGWDLEKALSTEVCYNNRGFCKKNKIRN